MRGLSVLVDKRTKYLYSEIPLINVIFFPIILLISIVTLLQVVLSYLIGIKYCGDCGKVIGPYTNHYRYYRGFYEDHRKCNSCHQSFYKLNPDAFKNGWVDEYKYGENK